MNEQILEAMKEAIEVACIVKAKGHDCFVQYYPHVDQFEVKLYVGGWESSFLDGGDEKLPAVKMNVTLVGITAPVNPAATIREAIASILETVNTQK